MSCPLAAFTLIPVDSRAAFGFSQFAADNLHASGAGYLKLGRSHDAFPYLARSAERWREALSIAPDEQRDSVKQNLAASISELHQIGTELIREDQLDEAYTFLGEALRHHDRALALASTIMGRTVAHLERANAVYSIGLEFVRGGLIDRSRPYFNEAIDNATSALEIAPTRETRVEGRFVATLAAIGLGQTRKEVGDKWFAVGTLARPADQGYFLLRLTEAAEAHQACGHTIATAHAESLARSVTTTGVHGDQDDDEQPRDRFSQPAGNPSTKARWNASVFQTSSP